MEGSILLLLLPKGPLTHAMVAVLNGRMLLARTEPVPLLLPLLLSLPSAAIGASSTPLPEAALLVSFARFANALTRVTPRNAMQSTRGQKRTC